MNAGTRSRQGLSVATRKCAKVLGASSSQGHIESTQRDMMRQHDPHNEKWGQRAAAKRLSDPAPEPTGS